MKNSCVHRVAKDSDLQYNLRQGWRHALNGYLQSLQLEQTEQLITMPVKLAMLLSKCPRVLELLGTESKTCLRQCLRPLQIYGDQA